MQYSHTQAFTAVFIPSMQLYRQRYKTAHRTLQVRFRQFDPFHRIQYQTGKSGYNTACAAMKHITAPQHLHRYQIPPPRRTLYRAWQPPIIIRYIRVQRCAPVVDPCQPGGVSVSTCTGSARRRLDASHARRGSPAAGARRAARDHWRLAAAFLFGLSPDS